MSVGATVLEGLAGVALDLCTTGLVRLGEGGLGFGLWTISEFD